MTERLLDATEAAALLNVPRSWLYEHVRAGNAPCIKLGKYVRFRQADLLAWIEACSQPGRTITLRSRS